MGEHEPRIESIGLQEHLDCWVAGDCVHRAGTDEVPDGECCPDFSCCIPELLADEETRKTFVRLYREHGYQGVHDMLMEFLRLQLQFFTGRPNYEVVQGFAEAFEVPPEEKS